MPEGPEVKSMVIQLNKFLTGKTLYQIVLHSGRYTKKNPYNFQKILENLPLKILEVRNKGKFIWFKFENNWTMWNTLGMTGGWNLENGKHTRLELIIDNKKSIWFNDIRNFGTVKFCDNETDLEDKLKKLGPDILEDEFTLEVFNSIMGKKRIQSKTIPEIFMNQSYLSGIGNYLKSEILYQSKISPFRQLTTLTNIDLETLFINIKKISNNSLISGGATIRNYSNIDSVEGSYSFKFQVYQLKKDHLGNNVIKIETKDKRTTHWVPEIQI
tara:strand:- start:83 stop:895 length:813 start_codon:yes stop_codon:yes gene_type:complete